MDRGAPRLDGAVCVRSTRVPATATYNHVRQRRGASERRTTTQRPVAAADADKYGQFSIDDQEHGRTAHMQ